MLLLLLLFSAQYLYDTEEMCVEKLKQFAATPEQIPLPLDIAFSTIDWTYCRDDYKQLLSSTSAKDIAITSSAVVGESSTCTSRSKSFSSTPAMVNHLQYSNNNKSNNLTDYT